VHIPDLRDPQRDAQEQATYEFALGLEVDLDAHRLVQQATAQAGLDDFGDPTLLDRLQAQVDAVEADEGLSGIGRLIVQRRLVRLLVARLRFEDFT